MPAVTLYTNLSDVYARDALLTSAPLQINEAYVRCTYRKFTAFANAAGIAENIVQVAMPPILIGLFIVLTLIELSGYFPTSPEKYSMGEVTETLERFAHMMLEGRQHRLQFPRMHSAVQEISMELKNKVVVVKEEINEKKRG
jgi:hypothetical protein